MKKFERNPFAVACAIGLAITLAACGKSGKSNQPASAVQAASAESVQGPDEGYWRIYLLDKPADQTWQIWAWKRGAGGDSNYDTNGWPGGDFVLSKSDAYGSYCDMKLDTAFDFGLLFVQDSGSPQTNDVIVPKEELSKYNTFYFNFSDPKQYYTSYENSSGIIGASLLSENEIAISTSRIKEVDKSMLKVTDSTGANLKVESANIRKITLKSGNIKNAPYTVSYGGKEISCPITGDIIDSYYAVSDTDFGVKINGSKASFKMWAPLASSVKILLFRTSGGLSKEDSSLEMTKGDKGVWTASDVDISGFKYYKYRIANPGATSDVCDIWAKSCSADSVASQLADINSDSGALVSGENDKSWGSASGYYNPFGKSGSETKKYSDAVIYEMHVRDWSRAFVSDSTGKFLDLANSGDFINHLLDLGVTHVQILPSFDYAETNADQNYNWGYNPYHYNVPEGRYVTAGYEDGTQAVKEFRTLISKLHDAGIAVNMDVVYNHTSGTGQASLYDLTVPEYFYRMSDGNYMNGSGCGNEIATNHSVVKTYVIESLKHWMLDYHINGFRFDLMGCHENETMAEIYDELRKIDPNVMVYGEPWTGGNSGVRNGVTKAGEGTSGTGYGAFDDDFRDAIKGKEFGGFKQGHVQGKFADPAIQNGLTGAATTRNKTGKPELALHYAECHDNYTLFDKLAMSYLDKTSVPSGTDLFMEIGSEGLKTVIAQDKLAAAYIFLSQGTPFINGGQEFLRTKMGNENSYNASDKINQIDLSMKKTYMDVFNVYKGLIALRKANPDSFGNKTDSTADNGKDSEGKNVRGITRYAAGDFLVYFNATNESYAIDTTGYTKSVDVSGGSPVESTKLPSSVEALSFVILKK